MICSRATRASRSAWARWARALARACSYSSSSLGDGLGDELVEELERGVGPRVAAVAGDDEVVVVVGLADADRQQGCRARTVATSTSNSASRTMC